MPAKSAAQQRAAGMALAAKRGDLPVSRMKDAALTMYRSMSKKQLGDYARKVKR